MLGLLDFMKGSQTTAKTESKTPPFSYAQAVKGYTPNSDEMSSTQYMEINQKSHEDGQSILPQNVDFKDCLNANVGDSGCNCTDTSEEDSNNVSSTASTDEDLNVTHEEIQYKSQEEHIIKVSAYEGDLEGHLSDSEDEENIVIRPDEDLATKSNSASDDDDDDDVNENSDEETEEDSNDESDDDDDDDESEDDDCEEPQNPYNFPKYIKSDIIIESDGSNQSIEKCSDDESEGGWISDNQQMKEASYTESDDEMFDLFGDNEIDYNDEMETIMSYPPKSSTPSVPSRRSKGDIYQRQLGIKEHKPKSRSSKAYTADSSDIYAIQAACTKVPSMSNCRYAFPRVEPDDITDICDVWETDFQVNKKIFPKMALWESLDIHPKRSEKLDDYETYLMYKNLYQKWLACHQCKEQWYRKYGWSSLDKVLHFRRCTPKKYPEECEAIPGQKENMEVFRAYYDSLAMETNKTASTETKTSKSPEKFTFTRTVSNDSKVSDSDIR